MLQKPVARTGNLLVLRLLKKSITHSTSLQKDASDKNKMDRNYFFKRENAIMHAWFYLFLLFMLCSYTLRRSDLVEFTMILFNSLLSLLFNHRRDKKFQVESLGAWAKVKTDNLFRLIPKKFTQKVYTTSGVTPMPHL